MSEIMIFSFKDPRIQLSDYAAQVEEIFFESSSKKDFKDQIEKEAFKWKYLGFYLTNFPEYAWVAVEEQKVLGYVVGMPFTKEPSLYQLQPHLKNFEEYYQDFPAHLHINCHHDSRGKGVGRKLTLHLLQQLKQEHVPGLHIMTGTNSENRRFYQKLGFEFEREVNGIQFMGVRL